MGNHCAPVGYDDDWIIAHWGLTRNWMSLCEEYNRAHGTEVNYNTFKSHCNGALSLNFHYSDEQIEWLKENYPKLGRVEATKRFNEKFHEKRSTAAIKKMGHTLGLHVTKERRKQVPIENSGRFHEIGTVREGANKELYVKTETGWKPLKYTICEKKPGKNLVYLDGNKNNVNENNLMYITRAVSARMIKNKFWSEDPEITRTGIICCELEQALKGNTQ